MRPLAIYDLDETITKRPTFLRWLLFWGLTQRPWRLPLLALQGVATLAYLARLVDRRGLKELALTLLMAGAPRAQVEAAAEAFAARELKGNVLRSALMAIATDRDQGRALVIATASMDFYAEAFRRALGFDALIATRSRWRDGKLSGIDGANCHSSAKRDRIAAWLAGQPERHSHVRLYSDHISDAPALALVDEAVCVNPRARLAALAAERGWRCVRWS